MSNWTPRYTRQLEEDEQKLYDHLLQLVQTELPHQLVERFRMLFVEGVGYPDSGVLAVLDKIAASKTADQEFHFILNRCCHILINRWQARPQLQSYVPALISTFEASPSRTITDFSRSRSVRRLRELTRTFTSTEQFLTLRRLAQVMEQHSPSTTLTGNEPIGTLIPRYPYIYEHCLLADGSTYEQQQTIRELRSRAQRQYEVDLSQFVTYQVRRSQLNRSNLPDSTRRILQPVQNPTLLNEQELWSALKHFAGKSQQGSDTYRDLARRFATHSAQTPSFRSFKDDLYQYITASIDGEYGKRQFNNQLYAQLNQTLPESNSQKLNDFLLVRTCSQLLNFLVVESSQRPNHFLFVDLIANLGPVVTTGLLLKIVLICRKVKPHLEKRFSILFNHYEASARDAVVWLVQAMEHLNLALSTNFSTLDLSFINQW